MRLESEKVVCKSESGCKLTCGRGVHMSWNIFEKRDPLLLNIKLSVTSVSVRRGLFLMHYYDIYHWMLQALRDRKSAQVVSPYSGGHSSKSRTRKQQPSLRFSAVFFSGSTPCSDGTSNCDKICIHGVEIWSTLWMGAAVSSEIPMNIDQNARRRIPG